MKFVLKLEILTFLVHLFLLLKSVYLDKGNSIDFQFWAQIFILFSLPIFCLLFLCSLCRFPWPRQSSSADLVLGKECVLVPGVTGQYTDKEGLIFQMYYFLVLLSHHVKLI